MCTHILREEIAVKTVHIIHEILQYVFVALLDMKQSRKIHLDTEVWSWGSGDRGQLGHADLLDR